MFLELYQVNDVFNTINKDMQLVKTMEITLKQKTDILTPLLVLYYPNGLEMFNYAYIDDLARYYFVTNIEPYPNDILHIQLEVDVLESYKAEILESRKIEFIQQVKTEISILESDTENTNDETSYILTTIGND